MSSELNKLDKLRRLKDFDEFITFFNLMERKRIPYFLVHAGTVLAGVRELGWE